MRNEGTETRPPMPLEQFQEHLREILTRTDAQAYGHPATLAMVEVQFLRDLLPLLDALREGRADTDRLEWLCGDMTTAQSGMKLDHVRDLYFFTKGATFRDAIDAVIASGMLNDPATDGRLTYLMLSLSEKLKNHAASRESSSRNAQLSDSEKSSSGGVPEARR